MSENHLNQWIIYQHPKDFPESFVVRRWEIGAARLIATGDVSIFDNLAQARASIPGYTVRFPRATSDDPHIVETWF